MQSASPLSALTYPFAATPAGGRAVEVAPGVLWLRMPLMAPLGHINVWLLADDGGWTLVDTGIHGEDTFNAWQAAFVDVLQGRPLRRVVTTHMHPDHIGMAGWLTFRFDCELWCSRLEYLTCRLLMTDTGRPPPEAALQFYRRAGWNEEAIEQYTMRFGEFGKHVSPLPDCFRRLDAGAHVVVGGRRWQVVVGRGHSPEHVCLHCREDGLLISGDQVLPRISSNVSVFPLEPEANPLQEWLESLREIRRAATADTLVLPAHGEPFLGLHDRVDEMLGAHEAALERLHGGLRTRLRAVDTFPLLFRREVRGRLTTIATGESLAHLNYLRQLGKAERRCDEHGVDWYKAA